MAPGKARPRLLFQLHRYLYRFSFEFHKSQKSFLSPGHHSAPDFIIMLAHSSQGKLRLIDDRRLGSRSCYATTDVDGPLAREQNCRMQEGSNILSAVRQGRLARFLLILNVICVVLSLTNLQAQEKKKEPGTSPPDAPWWAEILAPTGDVDFRDYMAHLCGDVKRNWFMVMPESAQLGDKGRVVVRFQIQKDGTLRVKEPMVEASSNNELLDKAAVNAIRLSAPFQHLPEAFRGPYIELRFIFLYNLPLKSARVPDTPPH